MTGERATRGGSKENIAWAYNVVGSGLTISTLCDLRAERDALREALSAVIDEGVVNWHDASHDTRHVHEALGLTFEQYAAWVERNWQKFVKACP